MSSNLRKPVWIAAAVVAAAAVSFGGYFLISAGGPAVAAEQGMRQHGASQTSQADSCCPMMGGSGGGQMSDHGAMMGMMQGGNRGCAMLDGKVLSVDRDGTLTVRAKLAAKNTDEAKKALGQIKAGDTVSLMVMLGGAGKTASTSAHKVAAYTCPMHPEVTSDKPGECPKCGMSLVKVTPHK